VHLQTTILREAARLLSKQCSVSIVDTHSEIAGCNGTPHQSVGAAKCCTVPKIEEQGSVMMQCARRQRPDTILVDDLTTSSDVEAALFCKRRCIRMIASTAAGSMRELVNDPSMIGLLGGLKRERKKHARVAEPVFDIVVELRRGAFDEWRVILDAGEAFDSILSQGKQQYMTQLRTRDSATGGFQMEHERL